MAIDVEATHAPSVPRSISCGDHIPSMGVRPRPTSPSSTIIGTGLMRRRLMSKPYTPSVPRIHIPWRSSLPVRRLHSGHLSLLDRQRLGAYALAPGVEEDHAAPIASKKSCGNHSHRSHSHAPDAALLDHHRHRAYALALGVEGHHAAAIRPVISRCDRSVWAEGHAHNVAFLDRHRLGEDALAPCAQEDHSAPLGRVISRCDYPAWPVGHTPDAALVDSSWLSAYASPIGVEGNHSPAVPILSRSDPFRLEVEGGRRS